MGDNQQPLGVILAGGLSRRMNGPEKSLLELSGEPLLDRVINRLSSQLDKIIINANGDGARFSKYGLPIIADTVPGFAGPLAGVLAAMRWAKENTPHRKQIITVATDTPFYPLTYVEDMNATHQNDVKISFTKSEGRNHPVFGMWDVDLADELQHFLTVENERKVMLFAQRYTMAFKDYPEDNKIDPFFNINKPEELKIAEQHIWNL